MDLNLKVIEQKNIFLLEFVIPQCKVGKLYAKMLKDPSGAYYIEVKGVNNNFLLKFKKSDEWRCNSF